MTVTRLFIYTFIALAIMFGFLVSARHKTKQDKIQGELNSKATATADFKVLLEKNEDIDTKIAVAEAIAYRSLELDSAQRIIHAIVAAHIINSIDDDKKFEKSDYTRRALLQVLSDQTAERSEPSQIHLDDKQFNPIETISQNQNWMLTVQGDNDPILLNMHNKDVDERSLKINGNQKRIRYARFSPHEKWLVLITEDNTPYLVNLDEVTDGYVAIPLPPHRFGIEDFDFSQDDNWFVTGSRDNYVRLWDLEGLNRDNIEEKMIPLHLRNNAQYPGHTRSVTAVSFDSESHWLGSGSVNGEIFLWNLDTTYPALNPIRLRIPNELFVADIHFTKSADTDWLIAFGRDGGVDYAYYWNMNIEHLIGLACEKHKPTQEQVDEIIPDTNPFDVSVCS